MTTRIPGYLVVTWTYNSAFGKTMAHSFMKRSDIPCLTCQMYVPTGKPVSVSNMSQNLTLYLIGGYFLSHLYFPLSYHSHTIVPLPSCRVSPATIKVWGRRWQRYFVKCRRTLLELNSSEPYLSSERKRKFSRGPFTSSMKRGKKMYKKAWHTCEIVVFLINCFFYVLVAVASVGS